MEKKSIYAAMSIGVLLMAFGVTIVAGNDISNRVSANENEYRIVLDANNGAITHDMESDPDNWSHDETITIEYMNQNFNFGCHFLAPGREGEWATMKNEWETFVDQGAIYNITPLYGIKSITVVHENIDDYPGWNIYWGFDGLATPGFGNFPSAANVKEYDWNPSNPNITTFNFNNELPNYFYLNAYNGIECVESISIEYSCSTKTDCPDYYKGFNKNAVYNLNSDGQSYTLSSYTGSDLSEIVVPSEYRGLPITNIGNWAFDGHSEITKVTLSEGLVEIGQHSFRNVSITELVIPTSVRITHRSAFQQIESLEKVYVTNPMTSNWGDGVFELCGDVKIFYAFSNYFGTDQELHENEIKTVKNFGISQYSNITYAYDQTIEDFNNGIFSGDSYKIFNGYQVLANN